MSSDESEEGELENGSLCDVKIPMRSKITAPDSSTSELPHRNVSEVPVPLDHESISSSNNGRKFRRSSKSSEVSFLNMNYSTLFDLNSSIKFQSSVSTISCASASQNVTKMKQPLIFAEDASVLESEYS